MKKIIVSIAILVVILSSAIFLLPNFLLDNFAQCHAENSGACCKKLGSLFSCTHISMTCSNNNELPVFKGCDSNCEHTIVCVEKIESEFGNDTEINKSCSADSDCKLPESYAIISSRRYEIKCLDYECTVVYPSDEIFFPTQKEPATAYMQALLSDKPEKLELIDGCLRVNNGYDNYLIVWPYGFSLSTDESGGIIMIIDDTSQPIIHVGDKVRFGGGEISGGDSGDISAYSEQLPNVHCSGPYWILGEIEEIINLKNEIQS